jgi:uncharacterized BrkB/YihY/UPF0761 family membrane protein
VTSDAEPPSEPAGRFKRAQGRVRSVAERALVHLEDLRERFTAIDIAVRIQERDKIAAGTLLGSALSLRLFLFFVPMLLFAIGLAGILGRSAGVNSVSSDVGFTGSLAIEIDGAFSQGATTPWLAVLLGLFGMAWTGRSLTRALVLSCALSWNLGGKQKVPARVVGIVVGIVVSVALTAAIVNRIRDIAGVAVAGVSLLAMAAVYIVLWAVLYQTLPRGTSDPGAALPGAAIVALGLAALQAFTQLFLPQQIERASSIYGTVGVVVATLGWFFFLGRALAFSFAVNAVIYEQLGSVSTFVFGLPGVRTIPRKVPKVGRFFDLEGFRDHVAEPPPTGAQSPFG